MELLDKLPREMHWNVIKYLQHPTAGLIEPIGGKRYTTIFKAGGDLYGLWKSWV